MSLCDSCKYQYYVEQLKPCIIYRNDCEFYEPDDFHEEQEQLDFVQPHKSIPVTLTATGHWIFYDVHGHKACKCSKCDKDVGYPHNYKYCPYCGHRMLKPQESEDNG